MAEDQVRQPGTVPDPAAAPLTGNPSPGSRGFVSSGWLAAESTLGTKDNRKVGRAMGASLLIHAGLVGAIFLAFAVVPKQLIQTDPLKYNVVFLKEEGRGGGGGGSPAPAPQKVIEIPKHAPPAVAPIPVPIPVEPPPTTLVAPIETTSASVLQSSGANLLSLAPLGGGGRGGGVGPGAGNGVGPGTGGGFGGDAYAPGNGVTWPSILKEVKPIYTPEAMRTKLMGEVHLEIIVLPDGSVGDVRITKSLDRPSGLDQAAIDAAKQWKFKPGEKDGVKVATKVGLVLEFRLH